MFVHREQIESVAILAGHLGRIDKQIVFVSKYVSALFTLAPDLHASVCESVRRSRTLEEVSDSLELAFTSDSSIGHY